MSTVFILLVGLLARIEYLTHILRFHHTAIEPCWIDENTQDPDCLGHYVCHTCETVFWSKSDDPWN